MCQVSFFCRLKGNYLRWALCMGRIWASVAVFITVVYDMFCILIMVKVAAAVVVLVCNFLMWRITVGP